MTKRFDKSLRYGHVVQAYKGKVKYRLAEDYVYSPKEARMLAAILQEAADAAEFEPMFTEEQINCLYDSMIGSSTPGMRVLTIHDVDAFLVRLGKIPKGNT